jgi:hypothetical protein
MRKHAQSISARRATRRRSREGRLVDRKQFAKALALMLLLSAILFGCSGNIPTAPTASRYLESPPLPPSPSSPPSPPASSGLLFGFVVERSGACIADATVQIIRPTLGERLVQQTPCSVWDYDGGFFFRDLTPGVELTLHAEAPGYMAAESTFLPSSPWAYQAVSIVLTRIVAKED